MITTQPIIANKNNCYITHNEERYFLSTIDHKKYLVLDKCPHRGGPLSLGTYCNKTGGIQCPWHENVIKPAVLIKRSLHAVRVGNQFRIFNKD